MRHRNIKKREKTLVLFGFDWDAVEFRKLASQWPLLKAGFDLFRFPSNARLAWFDMERFCSLAAGKARLYGASGVVSNHEHFGALCAALVAERMGWPGTPVDAVLTCQHKLIAREVLQRVAPEANIDFHRLKTDYGGAIPEDLNYPTFIKPVKAAFSVLAKRVQSRPELVEHTRFSPWERWVIRHLVEPFEKTLRARIPAAETAHSLMLEQPLQGHQYCLDGYFFDGSYTRLGVVDAVMYPGTDAFMRFDYPSQLPKVVQQRADHIAKRFMQEIGFTHGLFNMEFIHLEQTDEIKVIEVNPRMAAQFSDLYARVDGVNPHEIALALSQGMDPSLLSRREPVAGCASSFVYRSFDPTTRIAMPATANLKTLQASFPDNLLFQFPKSTGQIQRDFKWLDSYRYGILHLGGDNPEHLHERCERASAILGWPTPYAGMRVNLDGSCSDTAIWSGDMAAERAPG